MRKNRKLVGQATKLSSSDLQHFLLQSNLHLPINYHFEIHHALQLTNKYQEEIVKLFEINMKLFYEQSTNGYQPDEKREELFDNQSRYLLILSADCLVAFIHFRFDVDDNNRVIYLYELQVNKNNQGQGLGYWAIEQLKILCEKTEMTKIVLTVHKVNQKAIDFYMKKCQFQIDVTDPDDEDVDYRILSFNV